MSENPVTRKKFNLSRLSTIDLGRIGVRKHHIAALLEIDVTRARHSLRVAKRSGESTVSFLAWLVKNVAASLGSHPDAHGVRVGRRAVATFSSVNVSIMVERLIDGQRVPLPVLVTDADKKPVAEIEQEIHRARSETVSGSSIVIGHRGTLLKHLYYALPGPLRRWLLKRAVARPERLHRTMGSVIITSVGMGGRVKGWFIPRSMHPVCIGVGAVTPKAVVMNGAIQPREVLHMTVLVDHDVIDGAPASRWIAALVRAMELGREISLN